MAIVDVATLFDLDAPAALLYRLDDPKLLTAIGAGPGKESTAVLDFARLGYGPGRVLRQMGLQASAFVLVLLWSLKVLLQPGWESSIWMVAVALVLLVVLAVVANGIRAWHLRSVRHAIVAQSVGGLPGLLEARRTFMQVLGGGGEDAGGATAADWARCLLDRVNDGCVRVVSGERSAEVEGRIERAAASLNTLGVLMASWPPSDARDQLLLEFGLREGFLDPVPEP